MCFENPIIHGFQYEGLHVSVLDNGNQFTVEIAAENEVYIVEIGNTGSDSPLLSGAASQQPALRRRGFGRRPRGDPNDVDRPRMPRRGRIGRRSGREVGARRRRIHVTRRARLGSALDPRQHDRRRQARARDALKLFSRTSGVARNRRRMESSTRLAHRTRRPRLRRRRR